MNVDITPEQANVLALAADAGMERAYVPASLVREGIAALRKAALEASEQS